MTSSGDRNRAATNGHFEVGLLYGLPAARAVANGNWLAKDLQGEHVVGFHVELGPSPQGHLHQPNH